MIMKLTPIISFRKVPLASELKGAYESCLLGKICKAECIVLPFSGYAAVPLGATFRKNNCSLSISALVFSVLTIY